MYAKSTRPSAKREVQEDRSAQRDDQIARPRRAQACELRAKRAIRMCPRSRQTFLIYIWQFLSNIAIRNHLLNFVYAFYSCGRKQNTRTKSVIMLQVMFQTFSLKYDIIAEIIVQKSHIFVLKFELLYISGSQ